MSAPIYPLSVSAKPPAHPRSARDAARLTRTRLYHHEPYRITINIGCRGWPVGGTRTGGQQWQGNLARLMGLLARAALLSKNLNL